MDPSILAGIVSQNPKSEDAPTKDELLQLLSDPTQREVLRLHLDGVEGKVIAARLGISQAKVSRKLKELKHIISIRCQDDWRAS
jgi:DNA-binding NarL/FixJ family response regulator